MHTGDQVLLVNKQYGLYLHVSNKRDLGGFQEVNGSQEMSTWKMIPYTPHVDGAEAGNFIGGGDVIQLFHKEGNRILTRLNVRKAIVKGVLGTTSAFEEKDENDNLRLELTTESGTINSNSYWMVENIEVYQGGKLKYFSKVRFKHIATSEYLAIRLEGKKEVKAKENVSYVIYTSNTPNQDTVFTFESLHPQHVEEDFIHGGTQWYMLIKSVSLRLLLLEVVDEEPQLVLTEVLEKNYVVPEQLHQRVRRLWEHSHVFLDKVALFGENISVLCISLKKLSYQFVGELADVYESKLLWIVNLFDGYSALTIKSLLENVHQYSQQILLPQEVLIALNALPFRVGALLCERLDDFYHLPCQCRELLPLA